MIIYVVDNGQVSLWFGCFCPAWLKTDSVVRLLAFGRLSFSQLLRFGTVVLAVEWAGIVPTFHLSAVVPIIRVVERPKSFLVFWDGLSLCSSVSLEHADEVPPGPWTLAFPCWNYKCVSPCTAES
jgi:hypothetical protein